MIRSSRKFAGLALAHSTRRNNRNRRRSGTTRHSYDKLEQRQLLAFVLGTDGAGTLFLRQIADDGDILVDNNLPGNAFRVTDGAGVMGAFTADNLVVHLQDSTGNRLDLDFDSAIPGAVTLNLGEGARAVNFIGSSNVIGGNLSVFAGDGSQECEVAVTTNLAVGGNLVFDLGSGHDIVDADANAIVVVNNLEFDNVNQFEHDGFFEVLGNVVVDSSAEAIANRFSNLGNMNVGGDFTFRGGDANDDVNTTSEFVVNGNYFVDLGGGDTSSGIGFQQVNLSSNLVRIGGIVKVRSDNALSADRFVTEGALPSFDGDIEVNLGEGVNNTSFIGVFSGNAVRYVGGSDSDFVRFELAGDSALVNVVLGAGDDTFRAAAGSTAPSRLRVDFGGGDDEMINDLDSGHEFTFNARLLNWHGFDRYYNAGLSQWNFVQVADIGDIRLTNLVNGIELTNGVFTVMPNADNIRLTMMDNTGDVTVRMQEPLGGFFLANLHHGDRQLAFEGSSDFRDYLRIEAGSGSQTVDLGTSFEMEIQDLIINLRDGHDVVTSTGANLNSGNNVILRGVNFFENTHAVTVNNNFVFNTRFFVEDSRFDNDGLMNVGGKFTYLGGDARDDLILNDGVSVDRAYVNLGNDIGSFGQKVDLSGGFNSNGRVTVFGGPTRNFLKTDASTNIGGNFIINFSASSADNQAIIDGVFGGNYGLYRGGSGQDTVLMDAVADDMDFVIQLQDDDDRFSLEHGTDVSSLFVNFGDGNDIFNDEFDGFYPFPVTIVGLP